MADALAQDPTKINTPIEINETIALNIAIKASKDKPAPAKWVIELIGSLNFLYI